jgi:HK97 gp10 family phage protein
MVRMNIEIKGAKELEKKLLSFEPKIGRKIVRNALRKAAKIILIAAKANCPVVTGDLKKSLRVRAMKKKKHRYGVMVATSAGWFKGKTFYGAFVEYGTSRMPAKPFMRPAFDSEKGKAEMVLKSELKKGIEMVGASK